MTARLRLSGRALCAFALVSLSAAAHAAVDHQFSLDTSSWTEQPKSVNLAGEFNGWNMNETSMVDPDGDRVWTTTVKLEEGLYRYKFVIDAATESRRWINDPKAEKELEDPDGNGGMNSGVIVGPDARRLPPPKPNRVDITAVRHADEDPLDVSVDNDFAAVRIRVRVQHKDVERVVVEAKGSHPGELRWLGSERGLDIFGGVVDLHASVVDANAVHIRSSIAAVGELAVDAGKLTAEQANRLARDMAKLPRSAQYKVKLIDGSATELLLRPERQDDAENFYAANRSGLATPAWARDANWYQIFAERFRNGDTSNDPGDFAAYERLIPWNGDWWKTQPGETPGDENFYDGAGNVWQRRFGGDLAGVREKLPYLRSLGVNAIYFNPVFEAESMHKYDTADFRHIDDNFGVRDANPDKKRLGNRELFNLDGTPVAPGHVETEDPKTWRWTRSDLLFLEFLKDARQQGFRVIIDGVFNHTGRAHPFFQDVLAKGKRSAYADWFDITDWGDEANWREHADPLAVHGKPGGIRWNAWDKKDGHLPNFKEDETLGLARGPRDHLLAVTTRWLDPDGNPSTRDGIDGWRLDAANEVPHAFWIDFRKTCLAANPETYITGEIWGPAQAWVNGGKEFDAVMNYQFAMACQDFFVDTRTQIKPSAFNDRLVKVWFLYPHQASLVMQNLFGSHDTDRVASMLVNPDRPYDGQNRHQDNAKENPYSERKPNDVEWSRLLQMVAFQNTFIGAPMTYYGDEFGMWSSDDPNDRQPLPWQDKGPYTQPGVGFNQRVFDGFQRFIAIRNASKTLREGSYYPIKIDDDANVFGFAREMGNDRVYVVLNRSERTREITIDHLADGSYIDYADPTRVKIEMPMIEVATKRPVPTVVPGAKPTTVKDGKLTISLPAYGTAILIPQQSSR